MIAGITGAISDIENRHSGCAGIGSSDERGHIEVTVEVFDVKHLDKVISSIREFPACWMWNGCRASPELDSTQRT